MEFRILGPLEVVVDEQPVELGRRQRALLATLLLHAGQTVSTERLIDAISGVTIRHPRLATSSRSTSRSYARRWATSLH